MRLTKLAPLLAAAVLLAACTMIAATPIAASEHEEPVGNLAELMRAILFPNSNFLFDVQTTDPGAPPEPAAKTSAPHRRSSPASTRVGRCRSRPRWRWPKSSR